MAESYTHFNGKNAIEHVAEAQAKGVISAAEIHGIETPGYISSAADSAREVAVLSLLLLPIMLPFFHLLVFLIGFIIWRIGRSCLLGWARLERLHRILEQEKWEIEHNRAQEKDELRELYRAKGFEGKLLEEVIGVLMADGDRLLRVMVEEELGLTLENMEHPLKQGLGAGIGSSLAAVLILTVYYFNSVPFSIGVSLTTIGFSSALLAYYAQNRIIPAVIWNIALGLLSFGLTFYTLKFYL